MELVGGHPFLIRLALYEVAHRRTVLQTLLTTANLEDSLYGEHLRQHYRYLNEPKSRQIMRQVVNSDEPLLISSNIYSTSLTRLEDSGLIKYNGDRVEAANQLYRSYFRKRL
jgi:hypothetical protein